MIQFFVSNETSQQLSLDLILQKYVQKQLSEGSPNQMTGFYMKYNTAKIRDWLYELFTLG